jgi:hypothetical protein
MILLAALAVASGAWAPGGEQIDLAPWLRLEVAGGALVGYFAGALTRRIGGRLRPTLVLAALVLVVGGLEASEILHQVRAQGGRLHAPMVWVVLAPWVGGVAVWLGGLRRTDLAFVRSLSALEVARWAAPGAVLAFAAAVASQSSGTTRPSLVAGAATLDLVLVAPAVAWGTLVRSGRLPRFALLPLAAAGLLLAVAMVPAEHASVLSWLRIAAVPLEAAVLLALVLQARRAWRTSPSPAAADFPARVRTSARRALGSRLAAEIVATELALLRYACRGAGRDRRPDIPLTRGSGVELVYGALALVLVAETVALHLLVALVSPATAWSLSALSSYALLWLLGDARALAARGIELGRRRVRVSLGLRWELTFRPRDVLAVEVARPRAGSKPAGLVLSPLGVPNVHVRLVRPLPARGAYGLRRTVSELWVRVEDPAALARLLAPPP